MSAPEVCPATRPSHGTAPWRCQRAAGHPGAGYDDHMWPIESDRYMKPLDDFDAAWLRSEVRVLLVQIEQMKRERVADTDGPRLRRLLGRLVALAPANATRKNVPLADVREAWREAVNG